MWIHPAELCTILVNRWPSLTLLPDKPELPAAFLLLEILECAHAASLTREEGRPVAFRLVLIPPSRDLATTCADNGMSLISLDQPRALTPQELRRLAPATDSSTTMIAVECNTSEGLGGLSIRGLVSIGSGWQDFTAGKIRSGTLPPGFLSVSVSGPGSMRFECARLTIIGMENGTLLRDAQNVLKRGPVFAFLLPALTEYSRENFGATTAPLLFHARVSNYLWFLARVLQLCRDERHGGMFLLLRRPQQDRAAVNIKYQCRFAEPWKLLSSLDARWLEYIEEGQPGEERVKRKVKLDEAYRAAEDAASLIARLAGVDGCVVLSDRLEVLGFGAVVAPGAGPLPEEVFVCADPRGNSGESRRAAHGYGTRHQSAFRVCSATEDALAFVLSQDGGVKAVMRRDTRVLVFEEVALDPRAWGLNPEDVLDDLIPKLGG